MDHQPGHERPGDIIPHQEEIEELIESSPGDGNLPEGWTQVGNIIDATDTEIANLITLAVQNIFAGDTVSAGLVVAGQINFTGGGTTLKIARGSAAPNTGAGVPGELGSLYLRTTGTLWVKVGINNTSWLSVPLLSYIPPTGNEFLTGSGEQGSDLSFSHSSGVSIANLATADALKVVNAGTYGLSGYVIPDVPLDAGSLFQLKVQLGADDIQVISSPPAHILNGNLPAAPFCINIALGTSNQIHFHIEGGPSITYTHKTILVQNV